VLGVDQNRFELQQAARVFHRISHLSFFEAVIFSAPFIPACFDVIVLSSVLQYFQDAPGLISVLFNYLRSTGEIHILDTPLYLDDELEMASRRTEEYYLSLGFPEMKDHYFHHSAAALQVLHPRILYQPYSWTLRLKQLVGQDDSPFPWLVIKK